MQNSGKEKKLKAQTKQAGVNQCYDIFDGLSQPEASFSFKPSQSSQLVNKFNVESYLGKTLIFNGNMQTQEIILMKISWFHICIIVE